MAISLGIYPIFRQTHLPTKLILRIFSWMIPCGNANDSCGWSWSLLCRTNMPNGSKKIVSLCCSVTSTSRRLEVILGKSVLIPSIILNLSMRFKQFKEMVPLMGPPSVNTSATVRLHVPEDGHRDSHFWGRSEVRVDVLVCILLGIRDLSSSPLISVLSSSCTFLHKSCLMD